MVRFKNITVAVDFSPCSASALAQAMRLAKASGGAVHPIHVIDVLVVTDLEEALSPFQKDITQGLIRDAREAWKAFAAKVPGAAGLEPAIAVNPVLREILAHVARTKSDLLALGTHGESAANEGAGPTSAACVRKAPCHTMLVREEHTGPFKIVLAAIDFSQTSREALEHAARLAALDGAELHAVHVFWGPWHRLHYRAPTPEATPDFERQYGRGLRHRLEEFCIFEDPSLPKPRCALHESRNHGAGLVEYIRKINAQLVVLGTHGRTNLREMLLGSTAERVVRDTPCSIMAVRPSGA